ncbi:MAG: sulfatase [Verrucomicrobia bacterium]|nr:sulfatase [Verrucomicrobiota bacterium]
MNRIRLPLLTRLPVGCTLNLLLLLTLSLAGAQIQKPNVLFIAVDDLRPELGCYGHPVVKSPNIDRLATRGLVFNRAYCQQAVCSPSRSSLLTGRRPDSTKVYDLVTHFRTALPDVVTLPQFFKQHGYHAQGFSKIYHGGYDDPPSWSVPHWTPRKPGWGPEGLAIQNRAIKEAKAAGKLPAKPQNRPRGPAWEAASVGDSDLPDGATADKAIECLRELKDKPFFLAVGFLKPHLPFVAPKKYWELYSDKDIRLADNPFPPKDAPVYALHNFGEVRAYHGIPAKGPLTEEQTREMVHGYWASVSYMDAQVGRVLEELDRLGLREKTVVILWGDHGWFLGEHGLWCKHANYEDAARAALIVAAPGQKAPGQKTKALVEFVDIYPTLAELCGLPKPDGVEGTSFAPLLSNPNRTWKKAAFSQYPRNIPGVGQCMGYSIRTDHYRFVEWAVPKKNFVEYELYDHLADPKENVNLAKQAQHAETVKELAAMLKSGWQAALPQENY